MGRFRLTGIHTGQLLLQLQLQLYCKRNKYCTVCRRPYTAPVPVLSIKCLLLAEEVIDVISVLSPTFECCIFIYSSGSTEVLIRIPLLILFRILAALICIKVTRIFVLPYQIGFTRYSMVPVPPVAECRQPLFNCSTKKYTRSWLNNLRCSVPGLVILGND